MHQYSYADIVEVLRAALLANIRQLAEEKMETIKKEELPPLTLADFQNALKRVKASFKAETAKDIEDFAEKYGKN